MTPEESFKVCIRIACSRLKDRDFILHVMNARKRCVHLSTSKDARLVGQSANNRSKSNLIITTMNIIQNELT